MVGRSLDLQFFLIRTWRDFAFQLCSSYINDHQHLLPFWGWYCAVWWSWHDVPSSSLKIPMEVWFIGTTDLNTWPTCGSWSSAKIYLCHFWTTISWPETYVWSCTSPSPKVYRQAFWLRLGLLGGQTPKRLLAWSNDNFISALDLGKLCREKRESLTGKFLGSNTQLHRGNIFEVVVPTRIPNHLTTQALIRCCPRSLRGSKLQKEICREQGCTQAVTESWHILGPCLFAHP